MTNEIAFCDLADSDRSSSASRKVYYGPSFSAAGDTGTARPSSVDKESAQRYGDGGGASTTGKYQT
jgi:hypothetical protein